MRSAPTPVSSQAIDLAYRIHGDRIPLDHSYNLYRALTRLPEAGPWLREADDIAIAPIRGRLIERDTLALDHTSRLRLRLKAAQLPHVLPLIGQCLDIAGRRLRIGIPEARPLRPEATLHAHLVTIADHHNDADFDAELQHQLDALGIHAKALRGQRRTLNVKGKTIIGHSVRITQLDAAASIRLQEQGLGDRRKLGCGIFIRYRG